MLRNFGVAEILVIVLLVLILFGHNKIPGMMKNLADGLNVFKKELKKTAPKNQDAKGAKPEKASAPKKATGKKKAVANQK